jgi:hypothetical protein
VRTSVAAPLGLAGMAKPTRAEVTTGPISG